MPMEMWWFIGAAGVLLGLAAALLRPGPARAIAPGPQSVALLRGGRRAAVTVALVALQQRGAVTTGRTGTVRTDGRAPVGVRDPLQLAVHTSLQRQIGVRVVASRPRVQRALDALRDELASAGLLRRDGRWRSARALLYAVPLTITAGLLVTPMTAPNTPLQFAVSAVPVAVAAALGCLRRRTRAAGRLLASLRAEHPLGDRSGDGVLSDGVLMSVALYGDTALRRHVAHFARDGGLLGRGSRDTGFHVHHDATGGGASCGA
ncbi:TIGR04222 domain-containing membrane protein [Streptomyces lunaelactis]|uniref:TIGR04222 domain-containing membrane protein n=1 Tax=Streptomyces lunaelactis TaxID=1535768 RepID=UPI001585CD8F|nr:TIGR04222 domain-containing membrane protein [Streptomyces lunaelactis]NUK03534.1 TIGR04222 domain-containing membrane protein [Streptomyces lunaelactis]NUK09088.1 TIGR04222 domain-containing membrane protein [Streptomyces lunaelactis]NUK16350.1 TIGR04222 domain-containing membrane protein [Streptomyces lunaelactis]NUK23483.1 TIGR04222 domain-containing membrane protein [Streptomyces lunaelactis]NUK35141.1 TIGR04222 domain-containing membrane protein [Streptomyces lunaelactis]